MLTSIAMILLLGLLVGWIFSKFRLPCLLGMIIVGIILSPYALNLIDESILIISGDLQALRWLFRDFGNRASQYRPYR